MDPRPSRRVNRPEESVCSVRGCRNTGNHIRVHRFPKPVRKIHAWLRALGEHFDDKGLPFPDPVEKLHNRIICAKHFKPSSYGKIKLKDWAVPTLFDVAASQYDHSYYMMTLDHTYAMEISEKPLSLTMMASASHIDDAPTVGVCAITVETVPTVVTPIANPQLLLSVHHTAPPMDHSYSHLYGDHLYATKYSSGPEKDPLSLGTEERPTAPVDAKCSETDTPSLLTTRDFDDGSTHDADKYLAEDDFSATKEVKQANKAKQDLKYKFNKLVHEAIANEDVAGESGTSPVWSSTVPAHMACGRRNIENNNIIDLGIVNKMETCGVCLNYSVEIYNMKSCKVDKIYDFLIHSEDERFYNEDRVVMGACCECVVMLRKFDKFRTKALTARDILERVGTTCEPGTTIDRNELGLTSSLKRKHLDSVVIEPNYVLQATIAWHRPIKEEPQDITDGTNDSGECVRLNVDEAQKHFNEPGTANINHDENVIGINTKKKKPLIARIPFDVESKAKQMHLKTSAKQSTNLTREFYVGKGAKRKLANEEKYLPIQKKIQSFNKGQATVDNSFTELTSKVNDKLIFFDHFYQS